MKKVRYVFSNFLYIQREFGLFIIGHRSQNVTHCWLVAGWLVFGGIIVHWVQPSWITLVLALKKISIFSVVRKLYIIEKRKCVQVINIKVLKAPNEGFL